MFDFASINASKAPHSRLGYISIIYRQTGALGFARLCRGCPELCCRLCPRFARAARKFAKNGRRNFFQKTYSFVSFFKNVDLSQIFIKIIAKNAKNSRFFKKPLLKGTLLNHHVLIDFRAPKTAAPIVDMSEVKFSKILGILGIFRVSILKCSDFLYSKKQIETWKIARIPSIFENLASLMSTMGAAFLGARQHDDLRNFQLPSVKRSFFMKN